MANIEYESISASATQLLNQIKRSPTAFHAVDVMKQSLLKADFIELKEQDTWNLHDGGKYYVTRNDSSLIAFTIPPRNETNDKDQEHVKGYRVISAHTDSPSFKLKDVFDRKSNGYLQLNVEKYGGMICSSWMDRPLSVAGRVLLDTTDGIKSELIDIGRPCAIIPHVAIHMDREVNSGKNYNPQVDMLPLIGTKNTTDGFKSQLRKLVGVSEAQILAHDLYLYTLQDGYIWGCDGEFISAPRLDDLACAMGALQAFLQVGHNTLTTDCINILAAFDNEEVGSQTLQGAASSFLTDVTDRIEYFLGNTISKKQQRLAASFMLSADNAHALHPNHAEYADAQNRPLLGGGVVLKFNAQQRYATDAVGAAVFRKICAEAHIPVQSFANRSDIMGGSTLGNIASTRLPIRTIDIGLPQLAMHSAFETMGTSDYWHYICACRAFLMAKIRQGAGGDYTILPSAPPVL